MQDTQEPGENQARTSEGLYNTYYYLYAVATIVGYWTIVFGCQKSVFGY